MKRILITLIAAFPLLALAESENGLWESVEVSKDFGKQWSAGAEADLRTTSLLKHISRASIGVDASYKPLKWFRIGAGYTLITDHTPATLRKDYKKTSGNFNGYNADSPYWRQKHRITFDLAGKWKVGRFTLGLRERYQFTHFMSAEVERTKYRSPISNPAGISTPLIEMGDYYFWPDEVTTGLTKKDAKQTHILRSRFNVEYNIRHCPVTPCLSYEIQNNLADGMAALKHRATAGIEWKVSKRFFVTADYVYQHEFQPEEHESGNLHALSLGAKIKL